MCVLPYIYALTLWCSQTDLLQPCGCGRLHPWTDRGRWSSAEPASTKTTLRRRCSAPHDRGWNQLKRKHRGIYDWRKKGPDLNRRSGESLLYNTYKQSTSPLCPVTGIHMASKDGDKRKYFKTSAQSQASFLAISVPVVVVILTVSDCAGFSMVEGAEMRERSWAFLHWSADRFLLG